MIAIMPLLTGQRIPCACLHGIIEQTVSCEIVPHWQSAYERKEPREISINDNRHFLQSTCRHYEKYTLLIDSDVVIEDRLCVQKMIDYLDNNQDVGCVAVQTKAEICDKHIVCALALIRTEIYLIIDYASNPKDCQCVKIANVCTIKYLSGVTAHEIER